MGINIVAALWGFAEATLFFIVPDVWLSFVAREKLKTGLYACGFALVGALLGGVVMYHWGAQSSQQAQRMVERVPAIDGAMISRVAEELRDPGVLSVVRGPFTGTPYKVYAIQAAAAGISLGSFLLISIPARLLRFVMITLLAHYAIKAVRAMGVTTPATVLLALAWTLNYLIYFSVMGL